MQADQHRWRFDIAAFTRRNNTRNLRRRRKQQILFLIVGTTIVLLTIFQVSLVVQASIFASTSTNVHADDSSVPSPSNNLVHKLQSRILWPNTTFADYDSNARSRYNYPGDALPVSPQCRLQPHAKFCAREHDSRHRCFPHKKRHATLVSSSSFHDQHSETSNCQTLWFAGLDEGSLSQCDRRGIRREYAAALASAREHARGVLQPVLLLATSTGEPPATALREWALAQGAIVVLVDRLSFHEQLQEWHQDEPIPLGPYLRMDIPQIIQQHRLFDLPSSSANICPPPHVLYTDADILFVNPITHADMASLKSYLVQRRGNWQWPFLFSPPPPPMVLYGREWHMHERKPLNTGVMLMDALRFGRELPAMIRFRTSHAGSLHFYAFDQGWLNHYFAQSAATEWKRHMLPLQWNWKLYWQLASSTSTSSMVYSNLKVVHFHGPKPTVGAREMATCNLQHTESMPLDYRALIEDAACCDNGQTAARVMRFWDRMVPPAEHVC